MDPPPEPSREDRLGTICLMLGAFPLGLSAGVFFHGWYLTAAVALWIGAAYWSLAWAILWHQATRIVATGRTSA